MKYSILILVMLFGACTAETPQTAVYSVLFDRTDPLLAQPNNSEITTFIDIDDTEKNIRFRYSEISAVDFNPVTQLIRRGSQAGLFSNAVVEKQKADGFDKQLERILTISDSISPASHSSIFQPIVSEISVLQSMPKQYSKTLIVYSDLMENNNWISYFRSEKRLLLERNPKKLVRLYLEKAKGLSKNSNIKVHVVFIPKDNLENARFQKLQELYQHVFNQLGISISFSANLTKAEHSL